MRDSWVCLEERKASLGRKNHGLPKLGPLLFPLPVSDPVYIHFFFIFLTFRLLFAPIRYGQRSHVQR
jgi:hypothetical protein